jgi:hypothetical protein
MYMSVCLCIHREVVSELVEEYKAAERPDYVSWGPSAQGAAESS